MRDAFPCWRDEEDTPPKEIRNEIYSFVTVKVRRLGLYRKIKDSLITRLNGRVSRQGRQKGFSPYGLKSILTGREDPVSERRLRRPRSHCGAATFACRISARRR